MVDQQISMPSSFGGLMRYGEEYKSAFKISTTHVVVFIILIIAFVASMKIFFPIG